jgi:uncharacterized protein
MITEIIFKIAGRCNFSCDYCYMYEKADTGWLSQQKIMPLSTVKKSATVIADYVRRHDVEKMNLFFHGGEPLLAGPDYIAKAAHILRETIPSVFLGMQTNGALLDERMLTVLREANVAIGVSLDGDATATNRHRRYAHGGGTFKSVHAGLELLSGQYRDIFGGLLAVMDVKNDPIRTYEALRSYQPPTIDFLFPLGHYDDPQSSGYGPWLIPIFEQWSREPADQAPQIRLFKLLLDRSLGRDTRMGFLGPPPRTDTVVIQPNGDLELIDSLKSIEEGGSDTGLTVHRDRLDLVAGHPKFAQPAAPDACISCELFNVCGGGHYANRWSQVTGYNNPSIYCDDLMIIIKHIQEVIRGRQT